MPRKSTREMVGGCCVCSDERGWDENPLVYCDGQGCNVAVHQACYGIVTVPTGPWFCRKCESQERAARVRCELCPNRDGALKRTDTNSWAHVVCALYIPEVRFGNVSTMEPIVLGLVPQERYLKVCYLCEQQGRESRAASGACMQCNKSGCKQTFHVTCAQGAGLLCEEAGNYMDNVKYCGYCEYHYQRINKKIVKTIPAFKPIPTAAAVAAAAAAGGGGATSSSSPDVSPEKANNKHDEQRGVGSPTQSSSLPSSSQQPSSSGTAASSSSLSSLVPPSTTTLTAASTSSLSYESSKDFFKKGKKGRRPNEDQQNSPSSPSTTTTTSSSKQSSTSSLGSEVDNNKSLDNGNRSEDNGSSISKQQPVIVKFGKADGTYYSKKEPSPPPPKDSRKGYNSSRRSTSSEEDNSKEAVQQQKGFTTANFTETIVTPTTSISATLFGRGEKCRSKGTLKRVSDVDVKTTTSVEMSNNSTSVSTSSSTTINATSTTTASVVASSTTVTTTKCSTNLLLSGDIKTSACSVSLDKVDHHQLKVSTDLSRNKNPASVYDYPHIGSNGGTKASGCIPTSSTTCSIPAMMRKDSPAKIIPISSSNSNSNSSIKDQNQFGKPLKIDTSPTRIKTDLPSPLVTPTDSNKQSSLPMISPNKRPLLEGGHVGPVKKPGPRMSASGKRIGRPPKKGTLLATSSLGPLASSSSNDKSNPSSARRSPASSPERDDDFSGSVKRRRKSPGKRLTNGSGSSENTANMWMMGTTLNTASAAAREMDSVLKSEVAAHSAYDPSKRASYHGVPLPGAKRSNNRSSSTSTSHGSGEQSSKPSQPQTLEELLERQWEQGSQFLMEQASHFDIASLLSSLHKLKEDDVDLEDSVDKLVKRRDHLLAVRARLMALSSTSSANATSSTSQQQQQQQQTTPERGGPGHTGGPSPSSGRSSAHVSPRNTAATVSPIRVDRSMVSPRNLPLGHVPPPPPSLPPGAAHLPPPAHSPRDSRPHGHQLPSPRDNRMVAVMGSSPRDSPRGFPPMENGVDFATSSHAHLQPPPPPPGAIPTSRHQPPPQAHHLLTVVSSAAAAAAAATPHHSHRGLPPPPGSSPLPPPRQSSYTTAPHHMVRAPPPSQHGLPPPPSRPTAASIIGRPPMSHAFPGAGPLPSGYHPPTHGMSQQQQAMRSMQHHDKR